MELLYIFNPHLLFTVLIIGLIIYLKTSSFELAFVLLYFEADFIMTQIANYFAYEYQHNYVVFQYGDLFIYPLIVLFISTQIQSNKALHMLLFGILVFQLVGIATNILIGQFEYPSLMETIGAIFVFITVLYYYYELFVIEKIQNLSANGMFWIISVFFFYTSGVFFLNLSFSKILTGQISFWFDSINIILSYLYAIVCIIGFWLIYRSELINLKQQNLK